MHVYFNFSTCSVACKIIYIMNIYICIFNFQTFTHSKYNSSFIYFLILLCVMEIKTICDTHLFVAKRFNNLYIILCLKFGFLRELN